MTHQGLAETGPEWFFDLSIILPGDQLCECGNVTAILRTFVSLYIKWTEDSSLLTPMETWQE